MQEKKSSFAALLPIAIFLVIYIGGGILFQDFYAMPGIWHRDAVSGLAGDLDSHLHPQLLGLRLQVLLGALAHLLLQDGIARLSHFLL